MSFQVSDLILELSRGLHCYLERNQNRDNTIAVESLLGCTHNVLFLTHIHFWNSPKLKQIPKSNPLWMSLQKKIDSQARWSRGIKYNTCLWTENASSAYLEEDKTCMFMLGISRLSLTSQRLWRFAEEVCTGRQAVTAAHGHCVSTAGCSWKSFSLLENSLWKRGSNWETWICASLEKWRHQSASTAEGWVLTEMLKELVRCGLGEVDSVDRLSIAQFIEMKMFHRVVPSEESMGWQCRHIPGGSQNYIYAYLKWV